MKKHLFISTAIFAIIAITEPYLKKEEREEHSEKELYTQDLVSINGEIKLTGYTGTTIFTYK
ncbi:MAG TPA: hypothetical protein VFM99_11235 [Chitinophagales bacterium]|nr:hypothetical protein [Chitinophagales bacterium]